MNDGFVKAGKAMPIAQRDEDKYVSREFQQYGLELAEELNDMVHKALYIKLAKTTPRGYLESARSFVKDAYNAKSKGRLFMWKLKQIKDAKKKRTRSS
jgi:hypothetical protein